MNTIKLKEMLKQFFNEDIGDGDLSSESIFNATEQGAFTFYAKQDGIFAASKLLKSATLY